MKIALLALLAIFSIQSAYCQPDAAPYLQNKSIPAFEIQRVDNTVFTNAKLKKNIPVIIMYFSPTCDHCMKQVEAMQKRMNELKGFQIVMVTYQPAEELSEFNKKYQVARYPNITTGRDVKYFFPPFYRFTNFPFFAFYDKQGKLKGVNEGNITVDGILRKMK